MLRKDSDVKWAYSNKEIFEGDVVLGNKESGFWASGMKDFFPNPFLIKVTRCMWRFFPNFLIISEVWG